MAGISVILSDGGLLSKKSKLNKILDSLNYLNEFSSHVCFYEDKTFIGWNKYDEYPIYEISNKKYLIMIEGKIYNKTFSAITKELNLIIIGIENREYKFLEKWLKETDGDFILYLYDKFDNELYIINDILGRIPIYYTSSSNTIIVSRHLKFISDFLEDFQFDNISFAEILLMGFMIGQRTLINNVNQLEPASLIFTKKGKVNCVKLHNYNFDIKLHKDKSFSENIKNISELFSISVINRFQNSEKNILTLSGGLDSRVVAACLFNNNIEYTSVTMKYSTGHEAKDLVIAKALSELFQVEWKSIDMFPPKGHELLELLLIKEGMNSLSTSGIIELYRKIRDNFGNKINFITGDNGDKLIFTLDQPLKKFYNLEELISYTIQDRAITSLLDIKQFLDFEVDDVYEDFYKMFNSYPEVNLSQKFMHFRVLEKPFKYAFQGEDRHRNYLWNISPFWSFPFYNYLMNCPDEMKKKHRTFRAWIQSYSKRAVELEYTNFRSPITSTKGKIFMSLVYNIYPNIPLSFKHLLKTSFFSGNPKMEGDSYLIKCISNQRNKKPVSNYFTIPDNEILLNKRKTILYTLLTLTSAVELFKGKSLTLSEFSNNIFD